MFASDSSSQTSDGASQMQLTSHLRLLPAVAAPGVLQSGSLWPKAHLPSAASYGRTHKISATALADRIDCATATQIEFAARIEVLEAAVGELEARANRLLKRVCRLSAVLAAPGSARAERAPTSQPRRRTFGPPHQPLPTTGRSVQGRRNTGTGTPHVVRVWQPAPPHLSGSLVGSWMLALGGYLAARNDRRTTGSYLGSPTDCRREVRPAEEARWRTGRLLPVYVDAEAQGRRGRTTRRAPRVARRAREARGAI
jgi:hypothetical protein